MITVTLLNNVVRTVKSSQEASQAVTSEIAREGLGASGWYGRGAGRICVDGKQVAFVSYNGRVWKGVDDGKVGHEEIIPGPFRPFTVYENPNTSEVSAEFETLKEALQFPARSRAEIIRNGVVFAKELNGRWVTTSAVSEIDPVF